MHTVGQVTGSLFPGVYDSDDSYPDDAYGPVPGSTATSGTDGSSAS